MSKQTLDNIKEEISNQLTRSLNFPIQSQHEGNCASDSIQIILTFSDFIGPAFADRAIYKYYKYLEEGFDLIQSTQEMVDTIMGINVEADDVKLVDSYLVTSQMRYLKMMSEYGVKLRRNNTTGFPLRTVSAPGVAGLPGGTVCSLVFAIKSAQIYEPKIREIGNAIYHHAHNSLYGYSAAVYDPIVNGVLADINGYIMRQRGDQIPHFAMISRITNNTNLSSIVGIQVFCCTDDGSLFHTFTFFRFSGIWHIGDNEVGLATPTTWTIEDLIYNEVSFKASREGEIYVRTYNLKGERITVRYKLIDITSDEYDVSTEKNARDQSGMYRRYFTVEGTNTISDYSSFVSLPLYRNIEETVKSFATYNGSPFTGYFSDYSEYLPNYTELAAQSEAVGAGSGTNGAAIIYGYPSSVTSGAATTRQAVMNQNKVYKLAYPGVKLPVESYVTLYGDLNYVINSEYASYENALLFLPKKGYSAIVVYDGQGENQLGRFKSGSGNESITIQNFSLTDEERNFLEFYGFSRTSGGAAGEVYIITGSFRPGQSGGKRKRTIKNRKSKRKTRKHH